MVSAHTYPTFEHSDAVPLLAKTDAQERKLGPCPEIPYRPEIPSLTLAVQFMYSPSRAVYHITTCVAPARMNSSPTGLPYKKPPLCPFNSLLCSISLLGFTTTWQWEHMFFEWYMQL